MATQPLRDGSLTVSSINGVPTDIYSRISSTTTKNYSSLLLCVPGSPGVAEYYVPFVDHLYHLHKGTVDVCVFSHAGHSPGFGKKKNKLGRDWYNLQDQIIQPVAYHMVMTTLTAVSPVCPLSPFLFSDIGASQLVPGSPVSPFYGGRTMRMPRPSSVSPGPGIVPEISSPCLRKILASQKSKNKRQPSSPLVSSTKKVKRPYEVSSVTSYIKHSDRVPVTPGREEQVVPGGYLPLLTDIDEPQTNQRQLPSCNNERVKLLELFTGDDGDIFASREE